MLVFIFINSSDGFCDYFRVSSEAFADGPKLPAGAHLQNNYIQRPLRWTKHHVAHPCIEHPAMTGTFQASIRRIQIHRTSGVRTSSAVRPVFAVGRA